MQVSLISDPRVEIVTVLGAGDAWLAMAIGDSDERRLAIYPLQWEQGANLLHQPLLPLKYRPASKALSMVSEAGYPWLWRQR